MRLHPKALIAAWLAISLASHASAQTNSADAFSAFSNATAPSSAVQQAQDEELAQYYAGWNDAWQRNLPAALTAAKASGKSILVLTSAPWSTDSRAFEADVLDHKNDFAELQQKYVLLRYVFSRSFPPLPSALMGEYFTVKRGSPGDIHAMSNAPSTKLLPCLIVLSPQGEYMGEIVGYRGEGPNRLFDALQAVDEKPSP